MVDEERHRGEQGLYHGTCLIAGRAWCLAFGVHEFGRSGASMVFGVSVEWRGLEVGEVVIVICDLDVLQPRGILQRRIDRSSPRM